MVGVGFAILQSLAQCLPEDRFLLPCRTRANGEEAVRQLHELGVEAAIEVLKLDVTSDESIAQAEAWVEKKVGGLDGELFLMVLLSAVPFGCSSHFLKLYFICPLAGFVGFCPRRAITALSKKSLRFELRESNTLRNLLLHHLDYPLTRLQFSSTTQEQLSSPNHPIQTYEPAGPQLFSPASRRSGVVAYSVSKTALNALSIEMAKSSRQ